MPFVTIDGGASADTRSMVFFGKEENMMSPSSHFPYRLPPDCPPALVAYLQELYRTAQEMYREAGSPFGTTDRAMAIWYSYFQYTTRN